MLTLKNGDLMLALDPENGGAVARFGLLTANAAVPLFRTATSRSVFDASCFPLVPFANRLRGGEFRFRGRSIRLPTNVPGQQHPLHGQGWLARWQVVEKGDSNADVSFTHAAGDWPWSYEARQRFTLTESALEIALSCRNLSAEPMPCGLGLHPYFPCGRETRFSAAVEAVWTVDEETLPVERVAALDGYALDARAICGAGLDNLYEGWDGRAEIGWRDSGVRLTMTATATRLQVYAPADPFFAAEPVSHANCALNAPESEWGALGIRVLAPGEKTALAVRFEAGQEP